MDQVCAMPREPSGGSLRTGLETPALNPKPKTKIQNTKPKQTLGGDVRSVRSYHWFRYFRQTPEGESVHFRVTFMNDSNFAAPSLTSINRLSAEITAATNSLLMDYSAPQSGFRQRKLRT